MAGGSAAISMQSAVLQAEVSSTRLQPNHRSTLQHLLFPVAQNTYGETHSHTTHEHINTVGANQELGEVVAERPVAVGVAEVSTPSRMGR
jgi:hypothetical protein